MRTPKTRAQISLLGTGAQSLLRMPNVIVMTGLGRSTIYRLMSEQRFPTPVRLGLRSVAWRRSDVDRWIEACPPATQ
jgi:prophage regulatory protein